MMKCTPLLVAQALAALTILFAGCSVAVDPYKKKLLGRTLVIVSFVAAAALLLRLPFTRPPFYGLEYEDSYVYVSAGRLIASHGNVLPDPPLSAFLITGCAVGSLEACQTRTAFAAHYLGYPALLAWIVSLVGYTHNIGYYVALLANVLSIVLLCLLVARSSHNQTLAVLAAAIMAFTPVFVVYGTTSLSEPFSALLVITSLYGYCRIRDAEAGHERMRFVVILAALAVTLLFAVLVKRENLVLPLAFTFDTAFLALLSHGRRANDLLKTLGSVAMFAVVLILALWKLGILQTAHSEARQFGTTPFSLLYAAHLLPSLAGALGQWGWFMGAWIPLLLALTVNLRESHLLRVTLLTLFGYLILCTTHVRGFYFLHGDDNPVGWLRYLCNMSGLISIAVAFGVLQGLALARRVLQPSSRTSIVRGGILVALCGLVAVSAICSTALREDLGGDEQAYRIVPALRAERIALSTDGGEPYIVTFEPVILEMFGEARTKFVDISAVTNDLLSRLKRSGVTHVIFLDQTIYRTGEDAQRFAQQLSLLHSLEGRSIYKDRNCEIVILDLIADHVTTLA